MKAKILIVDDEAHNLTIISDYLLDADAEYEVMEASNGKEATQIIAQETEPFDLVLTDWNMPAMNGLELLKWIKKQAIYQNLPVILQTANTEDAQLKQAFDVGAMDYIKKPISYLELLARVRSALELSQARKELHAINEELQKKNEDITASITYAKRIQTAMLPRIDDIQKALPESFILFKPRDIVSGDFYYFKEKEDKIIIACADCTGHGVPGAFMSMIGNEILTNIVEIQGITSPDLILNELHKNIRTALKQGETENRDGMDISIITLTRNSNPQGFRPTVELLTGFDKVEYAGAMNPLYYVASDFPNRALSNSDLESRATLKEIKADKFPIGGSQKEQERTFTKHTIELGVRSYELGVEKEQQTTNNQQSTIFYLCSDGFQDQFGGSQGKKFMVKKFRELLFSIHHLPMDEQRQILDDTIESWMAEGNEKQIDDILVVGIRE